VASERSDWGWGWFHEVVGRVNRLSESISASQRQSDGTSPQERLGTCGRITAAEPKEQALIANIWSLGFPRRAENVQGVWMLNYVSQNFCIFGSIFVVNSYRRQARHER
jgi:hypothetical protein